MHVAVPMSNIEISIGDTVPFFSKLMTETLSIT